MNSDSFDEKVKAALAGRAQPSPDFEAQLFAQATKLLATRRERLAERAKHLDRSAAGSRAGRLAPIRTRLFETLAIRPQWPALVATLAALVIAVFSVLPRSGPGRLAPGIDEPLPAFAKNNDFSVHYDAQRLAEERAYEREVDDAHKESSGGI